MTKIINSKIKLVFTLVAIALTSTIANAAGEKQKTIIAKANTLPVRVGPKPLPALEPLREAKPPLGWLQFCRERPEECRTERSPARVIPYTAAMFQEIDRINRHVNAEIKPVTDQEQYGVAEYWTYPETGEGDCEDYVLLKRRLLMQLGYPREALLITVVRDKKGDGHAVLTVKTDRGDLALDNQIDDILPWHQTGYRYVKRQSQEDANVWVALDDGFTAPAVTAR